MKHEKNSFDLGSAAHTWTYENLILTLINSLFRKENILYNNLYFERDGKKYIYKLEEIE